MRRSIRSALASTALLLAASGVSGQDAPVTVSSDALTDVRAVDVRIQWGRVVVRPSPDASLRYRVVRDVSGPMADSLSRLSADVPFTVTAASPTWFLHIEPEDAEGFVAAVVEVEVPASIERVHLSMERGGAIEVQDFGGEVEVVNRNGDVRLGGLRGPAAVTALNGEIRAGFDRTSPDAPITLLSRNGGLELALPDEAAGRFLVETRSGAIRSLLPLEIEDLPGDVRSTRYRPRRARLSTAAPGPDVRLMTLNGDIDIRVGG